MADKNQVDIDALFADEKVVTEALRQGARQAMKRHIAADVPMVETLRQTK